MTAITTDQATDLRRMMEQHEEHATVSAPSRLQRAQVMAIASGKGGVGKSNIAVNLGWQLAEAGRRVMLIDADLGTANIDVLLGIRPRHTLTDVLNHRCNLEDAAQTVRDGLSIIPGASGIAAAANLGTLERTRLLDEFGRLERQCDVILIDCGAGISQNVLAFAEAADRLLLVATPEPTAIADGYALVKVLSRMARTPSISLVINAARSREEGEDAARRLMSVAAQFLQVAVDEFGQIPRDERVPLAVRARKPVVTAYPRCPAAKAISALSRRLLSIDSPVPAGRGFFEHVFGLFY